MDAFNFAFSLFAIILGLSLVEVLQGFARALKRRRGARSAGGDGTSRPNVRLGWLTPLLAIFVMLDLTSFWEFGWGSRRFVNPQYGILIIGLIISSLYYVAASLVFPGESGEGHQELHEADFDAHYLAHRRQVIGAVTFCDLVEIAPVLIIRFNDIPARVWFENALQFGALLTCLATRNKRANIAALALLIGIYLYTGVMSFIQPVPL